MADKFRFRHGQQLVATYGVALLTVIERSDFVFIDTTNNEVLPASSLLPQSNLAETQAEFVDLFVGVASESSTNAQSADIAVDISADSVYEFDAASAIYQVGDPVGCNESLLAGTLDDQNVITAVATSSHAVIFRKQATAVTLVLLKFASIHNLSANTSAAVIG